MWRWYILRPPKCRECRSKSHVFQIARPYRGVHLDSEWLRISHQSCLALYHAPLSLCQIVLLHCSVAQAGAVGIAASVFTGIARWTLGSKSPNRLRTSTLSASTAIDRARAWSWRFRSILSRLCLDPVVIGLERGGWLGRVPGKERM